MYLLICIAALWLVAAVVVTVTFFAAKRSGPLYAWLFGDGPAANDRTKSRSPAMTPKPSLRLVSTHR